MRHLNKVAKLGRTNTHRKATLAALSSALIKHKRITTTLAKAKALRTFVEPLISRSREDSTHNRRQVFRRLQDKHAVTELFSEIAEKVGDRPGGYTRVVKLGQRGGDSANMAIIELVDYNETGDSGESGGRRRRTRRGGSGSGRSRRSSTKQVEKAAVADEAAESAADTEAEASADSDATEAPEEVKAETAEEPTSESSADDEAADQAADEADAPEKKD